MLKSWSKEIKCNFHFFSHVTIFMSLDMLTFVPKILFSISPSLKSVFKIQFKSFYFPVKPLHHPSVHLGNGCTFLLHLSFTPGRWLTLSVYNTLSVQYLPYSCHHTTAQLFVCLQWQPKNSLRTKTHFCSILCLWYLTLNKYLFSEGKTTW